MGFVQYTATARFKAEPDEQNKMEVEVMSCREDAANSSF